MTRMIQVLIQNFTVTIVIKYFQLLLINVVTNYVQCKFNKEINNKDAKIKILEKEKRII